MANTPPIFTFPTLQPGWSVHWMPTWASIVSTHVSGREVVTPQQAYPLHEFTLTFEVLNANNPYNELQSIAGLFLACSGQYGWFYYDYPFDDTRVRGGINTGTGAATTFTVVRYFGPDGFVEPVGAVKSMTAVYLNGVPQPSNTWSVSGNVLSFTSPPGNGVAITADFTFYFLCRFIEDQHDYEQFMYNLFTFKTCKFRSVKQ